MRLIIVRHGETYWNQSRKTQGNSDIGLSLSGMRQCENLAKRFKLARIDMIFASPLTRAMQTAKYIANEKKMKAKTCEALREIKFGDWEGMTFEEIGLKYPKELDVWNQEPNKCIIPGDSETIGQVVERIDVFLDRVKKRYLNETLLVVTHTVPAKLLVSRSIGLPLECMHSLRMDNASITTINYYPERAVMRAFNDTSHLKYYSL